MKVPFYWIDAFTGRRFGGNPAGVVISDVELPVQTMQSIAQENNVPETAFVVPAGEDFRIRWFSPTVEVDLCGHATLASACALGLAGRVSKDTVRFHSKSGPLAVTRDGKRFALDFPARRGERIEVDDAIREALGVTPAEVYRAPAMMAVLPGEQALRDLRPSIERIAKLPGYGFVVTAPGKDCDFVSRFFAPQVGVDEDHATGSTHCQLIPYWSERLRKKQLHARQLSTRGGEFWCEDRAERVTIAGECALYISGQIEI